MATTEPLLETAGWLGGWLAGWVADIAACSARSWSVPPSPRPTFPRLHARVQLAHQILLGSRTRGRPSPICASPLPPPPLPPTPHHLASSVPSLPFRISHQPVETPADREGRIVFCKGCVSCCISSTRRASFHLLRAPSCATRGRLRFALRLSLSMKVLVGCLSFDCVSACWDWGGG